MSLPSSIPQVIAGLLCHATVWSALAAAQESSPRAPAAAPEAGAARPAAPVTEAPLRLYYLKDKDGNLVPVPGFSLAELEELWREKQGLVHQERRPAFSIQSATVSGSVEGQRAELTVRVRVNVREKAWVRVPLRFDRALLREPAQYEGEGDAFIQYEPDGEGYVAWIRGAEPGDHVVTMNMLGALATAGREQRLRLIFPRATTGELRLRVPGGDVTAKVSEGATLLPPAPASGGTTELTALVLGGEVELSWRPADQPGKEAPAVLEVVGAVLCRLESRQVDLEAVLTAASQAGPFASFQVRLPPGAEWVAGSEQGYQLSAVGPAGAAAGGQRLVEVRFDQPTRGPVDVRIHARRAIDDPKPDAWIELGGFEVIDASRQWGAVAVAAPADWQVLWGPSRGVRRVETLPEGLRRDDVVAGLEYDGQPFSLGARLVPRRTRIAVEPEYVLSVFADRVEFDGRLRYTVRGAKVFALEVAMGDWRVVEEGVGPENVVAIDGLAQNGAGVLSIPLAQPASGQFEVRIRARRAIAPGTDAVELTLPQPQGGTVGPAVVVVLSADNVELTPDGKATRGLVRQLVAPPIELPARQQTPLFYRGEVGQALLAAAMRVRQREVSVGLTGRLVLDQRAGRVEQVLHYTIAYEPADHVLLDVPAELAGSDLLVIEHRGQPLPAAPVLGEESADAPVARLRVDLPQPQIGPCEIRLTFPLPPFEIVDGQAATIDVPLATPADASVSAGQLVVEAPKGIEVEAACAGWSIAAPADPAPADRQTVFVCERPGEPLRIAASRVAPSRGAGLVIDRAWIQTHLTHSVRQDRAVFRFRSDGERFALRMPEGIARNQVYVTLDGQRTIPRFVNGNRLVVPLESHAEPRERVLEVRYHFPGNRPPRGRLDLELPGLEDDAWVRRVYWELVLPQDEHVLLSPEGFTEEFAWHWGGSFWGRKPLADERYLESWTGAPERPPVAEGTNRYLYGSLGALRGGAPRTAGRAWIVLAASGAVLVAALVLIYVPAARHPLGLLALALVVLGLGALYPTPALLLAQAAGLGLGLAILAALLQRGVARRRQAGPAPVPPLPPLPSIEALPEAGSTETQLQRPSPPEERRAASEPTAASGSSVGLKS
jgi:hypothetical protein